MPNKAQSFYDQYADEINEVANAVLCSPEHLVNVIDFETGNRFDPSYTNGQGYVGLIQFGSAAASDIGTTQAALKKMDVRQQLQYAKKYLLLQKSYTGQPNSPLPTLIDLYSLVLYPAMATKPSSYVFADTTNSYTRYKNNKSFDINNDGTITKAEIAQRVQKHADQNPVSIYYPATSTTYPIATQPAQTPQYSQTQASLPLALIQGNKVVPIVLWAAVIFSFVVVIYFLAKPINSISTQAT